VNVTVVAVGKVRGPLREAVDDYEGRLRHYWRFSVVEVDAGAPGRSPSAEVVRAAEAGRILSAVREGDEVVALTREGKGMDSVGLARHLESLALHSARGVTFVLGGAFGLDASVRSRSRLELSLTRMTLPHEMARLVLAEQLYRAGTILRNEPYHKGPTGG